MTTDTPPAARLMAATPETYLTEDDHQRLYDILATLELHRKDVPVEVIQASRSLRLFVEETYRDENTPPPALARAVVVLSEALEWYEEWMSPVDRFRAQNAFDQALRELEATP